MKTTIVVLLLIEQEVVWYDSAANFDLWIQNLQWNISQIPFNRLGLDMVGLCVILQKSMDSTSAETQGELLFNL